MTTPDRSGVRILCRAVALDARAVTFGRPTQGRIEALPLAPMPLRTA